MKKKPERREKYIYFIPRPPEDHCGECFPRLYENRDGGKLWRDDRKQPHNIRWFSPHSHILSKIGIRDFPCSVRLYSTFGGICGYSFRFTS